MVTFIERGNIFDIDGVFNYAHGCNCAGVMGKGIALEFKERFPEMFLEYKELCRTKRFIPGSIFKYDYARGSVFNLGTQETWKTPASLDALKTSVIKMLSVSAKENITQIALPRIGAGLGRLNWLDVKTILTSVSIDFETVDMLVVENFQ